MFACWLTYVYFNIASNNVNKKKEKKALFLATENAEESENSIIFNHGLRGFHGFF